MLSSVTEQTKTQQAPVIGRFAPSPTGRLHAGNIFAYMLAWLVAKSQGGQIVLRVEDLDFERSRQEYIDALFRDLELLQLTWDIGPFYQHDRDEAYAEAYEKLAGKHMLYPCFCTRKQLSVLSAPHRGEKTVYPGICRGLTAEEIAAKTMEKTPAYRIEVPDAEVSFEDAFQGPTTQNLAEECGDFVLRRSDGAFAYQLAVVVDDAEQGVNSVVRGVDLLCSTPQQIFLQQELGLLQPEYAHLPLLCAQKDRRLSKRDKDASLDRMLEEYGSPEAVIGHIAYVGKITDTDKPRSMEELLGDFSIEKAAERYRDLIQIAWG